MLWPYIVVAVVKISLKANNKPPKVADSFGKTFARAATSAWKALRHTGKYSTISD